MGRVATSVGIAAAILAAVVGLADGGSAAPRTSTAEHRWFVDHVTRDLVRVEPGSEQLTVWTGWLDEGWPRLELTRRHVDHPHWNGGIVDDLFQQVLGRPVDDAGRAYWIGRLLTDVTPSGLAVALATSRESLDRSDGSPADTIEVLYLSLLGRTPDGGGAAHHSAALRAGRSPEAISIDLHGSAEARSNRVETLYQRLLRRSVDPAARVARVAQLATTDEREVAAQLAASAEYLDHALQARELPPIVPPIDGPVRPTTTTVPNPSASTSTTSTTSTTATSTTTTTTTTTVPEHPAPERFTGTVEDFYVVPAPLPPGPPGTLIRYQDLPSSADWVNRRIMYHSRDAEGRDRAVTGTITYPTAAPSEGGWPVVSFSHGTTGIAPQCAPSRSAGSSPLYGVNGVSVATDYIGLGPVGEIHPYLSAAAEGHAAIDAVRAARQMAGANAGSEWFSVGGSQGAHAALIAGERSQTYAPELTLLGTVAMAPPAAFDQTFGPLDVVVTNIIGVMMLYGMVGERPGIDPSLYAGDQVQAAAHVLTEQCLPGITAEFANKDHSTFWKVDPREVEPTASYVRENEPGLVATPAPMYVSSGTVDIQVPLGRVHVLMDNLCALGQVVEYHEFQGADHGAVFGRSDARVREFLAERLAGAPPVSSCPR